MTFCEGRAPALPALPLAFSARARVLSPNLQVRASSQRATSPEETR